MLRVPTEAGDLWFKAGMSALADEARALEILVRRRPDCLPKLLAVPDRRLAVFPSLYEALLEEQQVLAALS